MSSITKGSDGDGDTETSPDTGPKTNHNLSIVYVDHNLDKPTAKPTDDEAEKNTDHPSLALVYIDDHLDGSVSSDTSQGSDGSNLFAAQGAMIQNQQGLFRLPPELRVMIWELLLPGRRLVRAKAWYGRDGIKRLSPTEIKGHQSRWFFRVYNWDIGDIEDEEPQLEIPKVLKICRESRSVALRHGSFIFGQRDKSHDTGMWWNPDLDVLGFDHSWDLDLHPWALAHLSGLEHVKNVAIDEKQAGYFFYEAGYNGEDPYNIPRELREPLAVRFGFRESFVRDHYIMEFFPHFQQLTIIFSCIYIQMDRERFLSPWGSFDWNFVPREDAYSATFLMGSHIEAAAKELRKYRKLCTKSEVERPRDLNIYKIVNEGPVYSVKDNDVDLDHLDHWMFADFEICQGDRDAAM